MKDANRSTRLAPPDRRDSRQAATPAINRDQRDARGSPDRLHENQQKLGVSSDHRTRQMKRSNRGTFP